MTDLVAAVLLLLGTTFMLVASVGLLRLPDLYTRMHAITKAGSLGVLLVLSGIAFAFGDLSVTSRAIAVILFVLITAPVSAHMIGRAGYLGNVPMWEGTAFDKWNASFDQLRREDDVTAANAKERRAVATGNGSTDAAPGPASEASSSASSPPSAS